MSIFRRIMLSGGLNIDSLPETQKIYYTATAKVTPKSGTIGTVIVNSYNSNTGEGVICFDSDVISIESLAFQSCSNLTSVNIPNSVTSIGNEAFAGCASLKEFKGKYATEDGRCLIVDGILKSFAPAGLIEYTIPDSVTEIGYRAFIDCNSLTSITIPNSVTSIGSSAFSRCSSLTNVTIGNSVTEIEGYAFIDCNSLTSITIPDSVTTIGDDAFESCSSLTSVNIGDSVTNIGRYAFYYCKSLTSVNIPDSVTSIGNEAFQNCSSLASVYITDIAAWCNISFGNGYSNPLYYAKNLYLNNELVTDLIIPDDATKIGSYAFDNCTSLKSVTIPDSVTSIGRSAFYGCTGTLILNKIVETNYTVNKYPANSWLNGSKFTSLIIGDNVTSIGHYAFYRCSSLKSITIPESVKSIGDDAFRECSSLTSITIPDSVTSIDSYAFSGCNSLTSVTIPDSVTSIGYRAFEDCSSLSSITCYATTAPSIEWVTFSKVSNGGTLYVPTGSDYSSWMRTGNYYLGEYNWTIQYI